jgi:predicted enzyme related to lactoylglutathione lyase
MKDTSPRFVGVELYFNDLERAKKFYVETRGLHVADERPGRYVKFEGSAGFVCLEGKGSEAYPSSDKAVLFFEVPDLQAAIVSIGATRLVRSESQWAVLHDPEGHNVLLLQTDAI